MLLALTSGAAGMLNLLTYRGRPPQDRVSLEIVIDDLRVLEKALRQQPEAERGAASRDAIAKLRAACSTPEA